MLADKPRVSGADPLDPTQSPREAGAGFRQVGQIADQVAGSMFQLRKKQQAEADKVSYTKAGIAFSQGFNQESKSMEEQYNSNQPNHEGFAADGVERMKAHRDSIVDASPESARDSISLALDQQMLKFENRFNSKEAQGKSSFARVEAKNMIGGSSDLAYSTPYSASAPLDALEEQARLTNLITSSSQYDNQGKAVLLDKIKKIPGDMVQGVIDREDDIEMRQLLDDMDSEDMGPVFGAMDPQDITKAKAKIKRKLEYQSSEKKSEVNINRRNLISAHKAGLMTNSPEDRRISDNTKNELIAVHGADKAAAMIDEIETYEAVSEHQRDNAFENIDIDKTSEEIASGSDRLSELGSKAKIQNILKSSERDRKKAMEKDFANYVSSHDSSAAMNSRSMISMGGDPENRQKAARDYFNTIDHRALQSGIPANKVKYLDQNLKRHYGKINDLMNAGDHQAAAALLSDFDAATGEKAYKLMDELDLPKSVAVVSEISDPQDRLNALSAINNKELDEIYKTTSVSRGISDKTIREELMDNDLMRGMSLEDGGTAEGAIHTNAMFKAVHMEYKRLITTNPTMSSENAKEAAWGIFEKRYDTLDQKGNSIPIPKKFNVDNAQNFIDTYTGSGSDYVKDFNLKLTPKASGASTTSEEMNDGLASDGRWVYNRGQGGLVLMARQGESRYRFVPDVNGKPVIKTFEELDANNYAENERRKKAAEFIKTMGRSRGRGRDI